MKRSIKWILNTGLILPLVVSAAPVTNVTWKSSLGFGASYKSGNTDQTLFTADLKGDRFAPESDWISSLHGEYGKTEGEQTEGQLRGQSDYRYKFGTERFFGGAFGEVYHDSMKDIKIRAKAGPDIGYYFIQQEKMKLNASVGANAVYEESGGDEQTYGEVRLSGDYNWEISDTAAYYLSAEYSARMSDVQDYQALLVTGLKSKVTDQISMYIELRDEYDSTVQADVEHNDLTITAGLTYDFF